MPRSETTFNTEQYVAQRSAALFAEHQLSIFKQTDHLFALLMILQWPTSVLVALWVSPLRWSGAMSQIHLHVWTALLLGGAITLYPVFLALLMPGKVITRYTISVAQMLMSALLIHLTGGRIETHFHVFGSLAFLSFYRDWKVLIPASIVVAADHWFRGIYWPESVYGVLSASPWRWVEHAWWVVFEDIFLIFICLRSVKEMHAIAERAAMLEVTNQVIEEKVVKRTHELMKAEEKLIHTSRLAAVGELAAGVAHEINNPLTAIMGHAQLLFLKAENKEALESSIIQESCKIIESSTRRCKAITEGLLNFSRRGSSLQQKLDLNDIIELAADLLTKQLQVDNITLVKQFTSSLPKILGNKIQLQQVILNIMTNAHDAIIAKNKPGTLTVTTASIPEKNEVMAVFHDTGMGISKENQVKLFQPFFTTKEPGKGTGLGLSICYGIIKDHEGRIEAESEEGKGSTFTVILPCGTRDSTG